MSYMVIGSYKKNQIIILGTYIQSDSLKTPQAKNRVMKKGGMLNPAFRGC